MKLHPSLLLCLVVAGCSSGPDANPSPTDSKTTEAPKAAETNSTEKNTGETKEPTNTEKANPETANPTNPTDNKGSGVRPPGMPVRPNPLKNDIPLANQEGWTRDAAKPADLAKFVDGQLNQMRNVMGGIRIAFDVPAGRASGEAIMMVKDSKTWRFQHPKIVNDDRGATYEIVVADGKKFSRIAGDGWIEPKPVGNRRDFTGPDLVKRWPQECMSLAFSGVGNSSNPWSTLVKEVSKPGSGLKVRVDRRVITFDGQPHEQQRFLIERDDAAVKKLGVLVMEMVVDKKYGLPMSMRSAVNAPGKKPEIVNWSAEWRSRKDFEADAFKTPLHATKVQKITR
ncbi:MAG: hypothetical protein ACOYON_13945 [Fimbriimonas sp.]